MKTKYSALRAIILINQIIALLFVTAGILATLLAGATGDGFGALAFLITGALAGLAMIASAQLIQVLIDIEANTRLQNQLLRRLIHNGK